MSGKAIDITGRRFGSLVAVKRGGSKLPEVQVENFLESLKEVDNGDKRTLPTVRSRLLHPLP